MMQQRLWSLCGLLWLTACDPGKPNPLDCTNDSSICTSRKLVCNQSTHLCESGDKRICQTSPNCMADANPICTQNVCTPCAEGTQGDADCSTRAAVLQDGRKLCVGGRCRECRGNSDCSMPSRMNCDTTVGSPTVNFCYGCK